MRLPSAPFAAPRALPRRLRRFRLLVVGCGDVGMRLLEQLAPKLRDAIDVVAVTRRPEQQVAARALGARAIAADLDDRRTLRRLAPFASRVVDLAPPPATGRDDPRSARLIAACGTALIRRRRTGPPPRWVYVSTTGVYGDCAGAAFDETRPVAPASARAIRRVAAERRLRALTARGAARVSILRAPGIYAQDRLPVDRLRRGTPALVDADDVYTNHIHADDLARATWLALFRGRPGRVYHAVDDSDLKMGAYFDKVADVLGLPRPPRLPRDAVAAQVSPAMLSFMSESRRLANRRLKRELRCRLRWPTVDATLADATAASPEP
ncbi:MAG TPA: NAD-dependent epimerase/dehydratase family protein [Burkholderiaceae bacterium]|nr:NAD-dependent epimerase/dehydratase family protein [Burkholderiaceae bacterium]